MSYLNVLTLGVPGAARAGESTQPTQHTAVSLFTLHK